MDRDRKPYCKEGESESHIALAWVLAASPLIGFFWALFFTLIT